MAVRVEVYAGSGIDSITSPSHPAAIAVTTGDAVPDNEGRSKAIVTLGTEGGVGEWLPRSMGSVLVRGILSLSLFFCSHTP